jgi:DnaJ-class molecular chaperone
MIEFTKKDCGYYMNESECAYLSNKGNCDNCKVYGDCPDCDGSGNIYSANLGIFQGKCWKCKGTGKFLIKLLEGE